MTTQLHQFKKTLIKGLLFLLLFTPKIIEAQNQTYFINDEEITKPLLEKIKKEYECNEIDHIFDRLDTLASIQLEYPYTGTWIRRGKNHSIYLIKWLKDNPLKLEHTLKHELGHMHGLPHDTVDSKSIMYNFHSPPLNEEELREMNKKYYEQLKKYNIYKRK